MELNYFKNQIFDLINESDMLNVKSIITDDKNGIFRVIVNDGSEFCVRIYPIPRSSSSRP